MPAATARRTTRMSGVAIGAAAITAVVTVDPTTTHVPLCPLHAMTGLYCPLCGSLRAVHALSRGAVATALRDNLLLVLALVLVPSLAIYLRSTGRVRHRRIAIAVLVAAAGMFAVVRNLPFASALRPG